MVVRTAGTKRTTTIKDGRELAKGKGAAGASPKPAGTKMPPGGTKGGGPKGGGGKGGKGGGKC